MRCTACDRSFCGYSNLESHIKSQRHGQNVASKPNHLVLLCVQCQLQFPTALKLKEHFILVQHNDSIPGIATFTKQLRAELRRNQLEYVQHLKVHKSPKRETPPDSPATPEPAEDDEAVLKQEDRVVALRGAHAMPTFIKMERPNGFVMPKEVPVDWRLSEEIKHQIYRLGLKLPMAVPTVPWMYCPSCKSFFTTFNKFNAHFATQRHTLSIKVLPEGEREKMEKLFEFIKEKEKSLLEEKSESKKDIKVQ